MVWLSNLLKSMAALLVLLVLVALSLPDRQRIERSRVIGATPEQIWPLLAEPRQWARWSPWHLRDPQMRLGYSGPVSGKGAQWSWVSDTLGRGRMHFDDAQAPDRLGYAVTFDHPALSGRGEFRLVVVAGGTQVMWSLESTAPTSVLLRWPALVANARLGRDVEEALARLAESVRPS